MDRREFLVGATSSVAALALAKSAAADTHAHHEGHGVTVPARDPRAQAVVESSLACEAAASDCLRHCVESLAAGDTSLADCMRSVLRMQAVVAATRSVVAGETKPGSRTGELVAVCADFCRDCAAECEPHAKMHATCKACMEACRECAEACDAYVA